MATVIDIFYKYYEKARQYPKIWMFLGVIVVVWLLFWVPHWEVAKYGITDPKDLSDAENSHRATLAQILGGVAVGVSLYYTWRRVTIAENELKVSQQDQITERFTRAIDQLGNPALEIRLGGIYALGRIADESKRDYWPIMEVLTAYIRINSNCQVKENDIKTEVMTNVIRDNDGKCSKVIEVRNFSVDIQAALAVIGKHEKPVTVINGEINHLLSLVGTYLKGAELILGHFENVSFTRANLKGANFNYCFFNNAHFGEAHLEGAHLSESNAPGVSFYKAHLEGAYLIKAHIEGAFFEEANLEGANLRGAYLENADFEGACLKGVKNLTIDQLSKARTLYNAKLDDALRIPLEKEYPELFTKNGKSSRSRRTIMESTTDVAAGEALELKN